MKNILVYLPVARFIQTGERTDGFMQLSKKARRKAEGARNVLLLAQIALVCENYEEGRQYDRCEITGVGCLPDTFNMFSLQPLQVAGPKAEPVELPAADKVPAHKVPAHKVPAHKVPAHKVPAHDFIDLKLIRFTYEVFEGLSDNNVGVHFITWDCGAGFDVNIFRAETGLYNGAFNVDQLQCIEAQLADAEYPHALIQCIPITVS